MNPREAMLQRIKEAVAQGNRPGVAPKLPTRDGVGYQGAGADHVQRFCQELAAAGGRGYVASNPISALHTIQSILQSHNSRKLLLSRGGLIERMGLTTRLNDLGFDARTASDTPGNPWNEFFKAEVGITNVHRLVAETGSVVLASKPDEPRSVSLLPPVHIALAERSQIMPDLFDLFDLYSPVPKDGQSLPPSCLTLITGPSKTGDIELKLVTGVHGPGEIHVILCDG